MSNTYQLLMRRYARPCLTLDEVRAEYLPHINSMKYLLSRIDGGHIGLRYTRLRGAPKAKSVVYLQDLADWLDAQNPNLKDSAASTKAA